MQLRKAGVGYADIGTALGISTAGAYKSVMRALELLAEKTNENAEHVRDIELQRLDAMLKALWPRVLSGDEKAIDRVLRIMDRRARYLGLDAPERRDVTSGGEKLHDLADIIAALREQDGRANPGA